MLSGFNHILKNFSRFLLQTFRYIITFWCPLTFSNEMLHFYLFINIILIKHYNSYILLYKVCFMNLCLLGPYLYVLQKREKFKMSLLYNTLDLWCKISSNDMKCCIGANRMKSREWLAFRRNHLVSNLNLVIIPNPDQFYIFSSLFLCPSFFFFYHQKYRLLLFEIFCKHKILKEIR